MQNASGQISRDGPDHHPIRAAIIGTGYIADYHVRAIRFLRDVEVVGVCDTSAERARLFAAKWDVPSTFKSFDALTQSRKLNCVHVLTPPDTHFSLIKSALEAGLDVFVEKPMCTSVKDADELITLAASKKLRLATNHNMLYSGPFRRLREAVRSGLLGPLTYASFNYFLELAPIRLGPYDSWMLREPGNVLLEIGPHPVSALLALVGWPENLSVTADRQFNLPGGKTVFRRWRVHGNNKGAAVDLNIDLGPGFTQRTIYVRGMLGSASLDFDANTCTIDRNTPLSADFDQYKRSRSIASQIRTQAQATFNDYFLSRLKLRHRGNPYEITIFDSVASFYDSIRKGKDLDDRISDNLGRSTVDFCEKIITAANIRSTAVPAPRLRIATTMQPKILILGGTGFIGRELVKQLLAAGYGVRAVVRGSSAVLEEFESDHLEIVRGDIRNETNLREMMKGIEFVYHLARSNAKTWQEYLQQEVGPARVVAEACLAAGIERLVYTGTIDSYYAGAMADVISENASLDRKIRRRNYYARAKAAIEAILIDMHRTRGLPVVILRPGIVIGRGGNPFHWGVGKWVSNSVCDVWGEGNNKLPFVLVTDVAAALVRSIQAPSIEGHSYNLVDVPLLTANEYLVELQRQSGMQLTVRHPPIWRIYLIDLAKWLVKVAVGHPDRARIPYYFDWESRTQKAIFDCGRARVELGWVPASDRNRMINEGIAGSLESWLAASS